MPGALIGVAEKATLSVEVTVEADAGIHLCHQAQDKVRLPSWVK